MIDPTARISPTASIAPDAEIGPNVIVGESSSVGSGTIIMANAVIGPWTSIGSNNVIHYGAIVGHDPQDFGYKGEENYVKIGDGNIIREYVTIHRGNREGTSTIIGNNNFLMIQSHIAHNCVMGDNVIVAGGSLLAGHVTNEDRAVFPAIALYAILRISKYAMMRGLSRTSRDVPPFCIMDDTIR
jgi:UDP-N-acetylglucosamine acyltransferase